ncbi:DUF1934 domain-containing protein [Pelosinus propionicus]|uniref:Uncharacterized beta-barrel protein YwiB, DUF1934 family n=1 Tax=Pelosinus propionicus DSM 13327 TaxID=1123291 RepID=A0A1I4KDW4_9FIRM|nr:DUF1934 domain-containing protein [Pelosinus propionicus]SFL76928.1 Uncharacterized beta-barrel protein YwiB, DUF1934 family [Pelosinus propionicus DSM 13327]
MIDIVITIVGTQKDEKGEESYIECTTKGRYYEKNNIRYIVYKDSEISGLDGVTTMLKVHDRHVALVRTGSVDHKQEFLLGQKSCSAYHTPYGTMQMNIQTNSLRIDLTSATGTVAIEYELEINGQWQSANTLSISIQEESISGY